MTLESSYNPNLGALCDVTPAEAPLLRLLGHLKRDGYRFTTPTPETHKRVVRRVDKVRATSLRDVFGWSLPFSAKLIPVALLQAMNEAGIVHSTLRGLRATIRVSSLQQGDWD